jgi:zinc/manganese transport system substrate-binding protein
MARRSKWLLAASALLALALAIATGCGEEAGSGGELEVVATTTHVADLTRSVGGDRASVRGLLAPNSDPHDYEPRPSDAAAVAEADLVVESGGDLDLWAKELVESGGGDAPVVTLIDSVETIAGEHDGGEEGAGEEHGDEGETGDEHQDDELDPHWWQDPTRAIAAVEEIRDQLVAVDPDGTETYKRNARTYIGKLTDLDRQIAECMSGIPAEQRKLVTSHDSLDYFAERYGIEVVGAAIPALTTQAQPSAGETDELIDQIESEGVRAVFPEAGLDPRLERAIASETGATVGGELWADALGPEGSGGATYLEATASNAEEMAAGFTGRTGGCEIDLE